MWWLPRFHKMGWAIKPLGLPELISGECSVAVMLPIDAKILASTRAAHGIDSSVLDRPAQHDIATRERQTVPRQ
jgi:N-acyl-L-homoserine lactone synthetase